jgi:hypothetical protein
MFPNTAPERNCANDHRQSQPDFMDDRLAQKPTCRRQEPQQHCRCDAMHGAETRQAHGDPVEPMGMKRTLRHVAGQ